MPDLRTALRGGVTAFAVVCAGLVTGASGAMPAAAASRPPVVRPADPIAHDPAMVKEGDWYYLAITGDAATHTYLPVKRSQDLVHWSELGPVFSTLPSWVVSELGVTPPDAWAPDLVRTGDHWSLYYAVSQFGTQNSVIGLATTATLDPGSPDFGWHDQGLVMPSHQGVEDYNAIDPDYSLDEHGDPWLAFGSFWGGIKIRRLDAASGKPTDGTILPLATRVAPDAEEGPAITRHGDWYYLFLSFDFCCRGLDADYRLMVGRSHAITGPYVDRSGRPLLEGGGTEVLRGYNEFLGTGGASITHTASGDLLVNHYYDATDQGAPRLNVRPLSFADGWPVVGDPLNPSRSVGHGEAYVQILDRSSGLPVTDVGCGYEGADIALGAVAPADTCSQWQLDPRGGGRVSLLNRFSNKVAEVAACTNVDGGNVAQWGWLANDCQRWTVRPGTDGYASLQSALPGARRLDVAGCGTTPGTDVDLWSATGTGCQDFAFAPVGDVLLGVPGDAQAALGVRGCSAAHPGGTRVEPTSRSRIGCPLWRVSSAGGATYTVTNVATGTVLATSRCGTRRPEKGKLRLAAAGDGVCDRWTLLPAGDGTWALSVAGTSVTTRVRLLLP